jgi:hypothetical protein
MRHLWRLSIGLVIALVSLVAGCKEGGPGSQAYVAKPGAAKIRLAIVPFDSVGLQQENAARIVTDEVMTSLLGTGLFDVIEPGMVYQALSDSGTRNPSGLDSVLMQKLQEKLGPVQAFVVGMVGEFGEVRVGPMTYPSISVSARVLDAQSGAILWAGSASRTGAESEKLFGLGAVHSTGRLARAVVRDLIAGISRGQLASLLKATPTAPGAANAVSPVAATTPGVPGTAAAPTGKEKFMDEGATYAEATLRALMLDVEGLTKGEVGYRQHHFPVVEVSYEGQGVSVAVKLVDCLKREAALALVKHDHPNEPEGRFAGLPAYAVSSPAQTPGAYHRDVAVGRFALFMSGPETKKADLEKVAQAIIQGMK